MNATKLLLAAVLASSTASAQVITRTVVESGFASDSATGGPAVTSSFGPALSADAAVSSCVASEPGLAGVDLISVEVHGELTTDVVGVFVGIAPSGTDIDGYARHGFAADSANQWGPFDWYSFWSNFETQTSIGLGEVRVITDSYAVGFGGTYTRGGGYWSAVLQHPCFDAVASVSGVDWVATDASGAPTDIEMASLVVSATADSTVTAVFELATTPVTNYCSSQANGLNVHGVLDAFGSPTADSEWLTIRTRDVPEQSAGILFMGADIVVVPGGTTTLCVGGNIQRVGGVQVVNGGFADFEISLAGFLPGDTARFQCFHRDPVVGVAATDAFVMTVQ